MIEPPAHDRELRPARYAAVAIVLHWLIAAAILVQVALAWRMVGRNTPEGFALTQLHKSIGVCILGLSLVRLGWRLAKPPPAEPSALTPWEARLAGLVHGAFYVVMIGLPLTGWLMVSASPTNIPTLLFGRIPFPHLPSIPDLAPPLKAAVHTVGDRGHVALAWLLYGLFGLHVAGALKHQLLRGDAPVFARMAPGASAGRWAEPRLLAVLLGAAAALAVGAVAQPPRPAAGPPVAGPSLAELARDLPPAPVRPAAATPTAEPAPPAAPVRWTVRSGSTLGFVSSWSGAPVEGRFERWTADIVFSPAALDRSRIAVTVDMASARTGDAQRDSSLPGDDWFDAAAHPKATFTATRIEALGPERYVAHGVLELRGVRRPVDLRFRLRLNGARAEVSGQASLDRTSFGVGRGAFAGVDQIPAKVGVVIRLSATS